MKNKAKTLLALAGILSACGGTPTAKSSSTALEEKADCKVICPTGAPAVGFYNHFQDENFETNSVPSNVVSFLSESSPYDIVVIDTVSGIKAINGGAPYKIHSSITFGNFFIASTGNDEDGVMGIDDKIVLFGENQTPDLVFHYIYGDKYDNAIEWVNAVSDAAGCLASGVNVATSSTVDYVFVAQPVLFATLNNKNAATYGRASIYKNIQDEYKAKSNNKSLVQASIFVKNSDKYSYDSYLSDLESDINAALTNPALITDKLGGEDENAVKTKYGIAPNVIKAVISQNNGLGLGFKKASENKENINNFLSIFGMDEIKDEIIA